MPEMDGFELIRSLRQSHPNLPVLVISGASDSLLKEATELGAVGSAGEGGLGERQRFLREQISAFLNGYHPILRI
jgi:CheY-like chemotaxis protein